MSGSEGSRVSRSSTPTTAYGAQALSAPRRRGAAASGAAGFGSADSFGAAGSFARASSLGPASRFVRASSFGAAGSFAGAGVSFAVGRSALHSASQPDLGGKSNRSSAGGRKSPRFAAATAMASPTSPPKSAGNSGPSR